MNTQEQKREQLTIIEKLQKNIKDNQGKWLVAICIFSLLLISGAIYFFWYLPRTPLYTFKIIRTAIVQHDSQTVLKHVAVDDITGNLLAREIDSDPSLKNNPFAKLLMPTIKNVVAQALEDTIRTSIEKKDNTEEANLEDSKNGMADKASKGLVSAIDGSLDNAKGKISVKNATSTIDPDTNIATMIITLHNKENNQDFDLKVLARQLPEGTWQIFDIPNLMDATPFLKTNQNI